MLNGILYSLFITCHVVCQARTFEVAPPVLTSLASTGSSWALTHNLVSTLQSSIVATVLSMVKEVAWGVSKKTGVPRGTVICVGGKRAVRRIHIPGGFQSRIWISTASPVASYPSGKLVEVEYCLWVEQKKVAYSAIALCNRCCRIECIMTASLTDESARRASSRGSSRRPVKCFRWATTRFSFFWRAEITGVKEAGL